MITGVLVIAGIATWLPARIWYNELLQIAGSVVLVLGMLSFVVAAFRQAARMSKPWMVESMSVAALLSSISIAVFTFTPLGRAPTILFGVVAIILGLLWARESLLESKARSADTNAPPH